MSAWGLAFGVAFGNAWGALPVTPPISPEAPGRLRSPAFHTIVTEDRQARRRDEEDALWLTVLS